MPAWGNFGAGSIRSPMPPTQTARRVEAGGNIGAEPRAERRQRRLVEREAPQRAQRPQCRRGVARPAADAGGDREVLFEMQRRAGRTDAGMLGKQARGAQHQIVVAIAGEARRLGPGHLQRQRGCRPDRHPIADVGEGDEAVDEVIAVRPAPGQMQNRG